MNKGLLYCCFVITIMLLTISAIYPASAEIYTVTNTDDSGPGSLSSALSELDFWDINNSEIHFNIPGPGVHTIALLSPIVFWIHTRGAVIDGYTQPGSSPNTLTDGNNAVLLIEINGSSAGAGESGFTVTGTNITIRGLVINGFSQYGIRQTGGSTGLHVAGNFVGTNPSGTAAGPGNGLSGILLNASGGAGSSNIIGGGTPAERNVISGNGWGGIQVGSPDKAVIQNNYIGTDASGTAAVGNGYAGILMRFGSDHVIGGQTTDTHNLISGNSGYGLNIDNGVTGLTTQGIVVQGNYIGTNYNGTSAIPNLWNGIYLDGGGKHVINNTIGGILPGSGNIISGNGENGILLQSGEFVGYTGSVTGNIIQGNSIGINALGNPLPNGQNGIVVNSTATSSPAGQNIIGGSEDAANIIAHNGGRGVTITGSNATGNAILSNSIFSNSLLGIDLAADGVTANDTDDKDAGPNNLQNFPVLSSAQTACGYTNVRGTLNSSPDTTYTVQFFSNKRCNASGNGEGQTYLGQTTAKTDKNGDADFSIVVPSSSDGMQVTATATDPLGNTSEFSPCLSVDLGSVFSVNSTTDWEDTSIGDGVCATATLGCTLRAAVQEANSHPGSFFCISVPAGYYLLTLAGAGEDAAATGDLDILNDMVIQGAGKERTLIACNERIFHVNPLGSVVAAAISGIGMSGGISSPSEGSCISNNGVLLIEDCGMTACHAVFGGGIYNQGNVTMINSEITINSAAYGGGIYTKWGNFRLINSTLWGNTATVTGGGINSFEYGSLEVTNSTLSGNSSFDYANPAASLYGGGINAEAGTVTITNSTIADNLAYGGGGGVNVISATGSVKNSIIASNVGGNCAGPDLTSLGHNLSSDNTCGFTASGDIENLLPLLGLLANNGGPVRTRALLPGSAAIDAGTDSGTTATDQRGISRTYGSAVDIGAYEFIPAGSAPVRIAGATPVYYPTIQFGYGATAGGDILQAQDVTFTETLLFNRTVAITLQGGFDAGFSAPGSFTTVIGQVAISAGTVTIGNLLIR